MTTLGVARELPAPRACTGPVGPAAIYKRKKYAFISLKASYRVHATGAMRRCSWASFSNASNIGNNKHGQAITHCRLYSGHRPRHADRPGSGRCRELRCRPSHRQRSGLERLVPGQPWPLPQPHAGRPAAVGKSNTSLSKIVPVPAGALPRVPTGFHGDPIFRSDATAPRLDPHRTQRRHLRGREHGGPDSHPAPVRDLQAGWHGGVCHRSRPAVRHRVLPARPQPEFVYIADNKPVVRFPYSRR